MYRKNKETKKESPVGITPRGILLINQIKLSLSLSASQ